MNFDALHYPHPSRRTAVYARKGMVATSHPLQRPLAYKSCSKAATPLTQRLPRLRR
ncbi:hypothetical protein GCM10025859_43760 [Alicyclobacillus fastidiosus]|nr:hypothetical protein GCM10025859_43760 [Alicyclobacillus fastidiosus]